MKKLSMFLSTLIISSYGQARDMTFIGQDFPPFNFEENKVFTGGMVDVMKEVCIQLKHNCKFQMAPVARALKMLEDGEIDGVLSLNPNPDRDSFAISSTPIIAANIVYMAPKENKVPKFANIKELAGWTVAGVRASSVIKSAKQHQEEVKSITIREEVDYKAVIQHLKNKQYGNKTVIIGTEDVLNYFADRERFGIDTVYLIKEIPFVTSFGKKKISSAEIEAFNKAIAELKSSGKLKSILEKYHLRGAQ